MSRLCTAGSGRPHALTSVLMVDSALAVVAE
jgi:hypothetical protein